MAAIILPYRMRQQPQGNPVLDRGHPLLRGVTDVFLPHLGRGLITGTNGTMVSAGTGTAKILAGTSGMTLTTTTGTQCGQQVGTGTKLFPGSECTIFIFRRSKSTTGAQVQNFGYSVSTSNRVLISAPWNDGNCYWDYGNTTTTAGGGRGSAAFTKVLTPETLTFVAGTSRGREIWRNGVNLSANTAVNLAPTITATTTSIGGTGISESSDSEEVYLVGVVARTWDPAEIREWARNPWGIFKQNPNRKIYTWGGPAQIILGASLQCVATQTADLSTQTHFSASLQCASAVTADLTAPATIILGASLAASSSVTPDIVAGVVGYYIDVTVPAGKVNSDLSNFPAYVDLSGLPSSFWSHVSSTGNELRAEVAGVRIPIDLSYFSKSGNVGWLFVKPSTVFSGSSTVVRIYYGGQGAKAADSSTYGRNSVWGDYHRVTIFSEPGVDRSGHSYGAFTRMQPGKAFTGTVVKSSFGYSVEGQGVEWDGTNYYVTDTTSLYKYDSTWALLTSYSNIAALSPGGDHLGDPCMVGSELWVPAGNSTGPEKRWIRVNPSDLSVYGLIDPDDVGRGISGLSYNPDDGYLWATDYGDGSSIMRYDTSGAYVDAITLGFAIPTIQGLTFLGGNIYVSQGSGRIWELSQTGAVRRMVYNPISNIGEGICTKDAGLIYINASGASSAVSLTWSSDPTNAATNWLNLNGSGCWGEFTGITKFTQWSMGVSALLTSKSANRGLLSYCDSTGVPSTTRATLAYHAATDRFGLFNNTDSWLDSSSSPSTATVYRLNATHDGTTARKLYVSGTPFTDSGVGQFPGGTADALFLGVTDSFPDDATPGRFNFAYIRSGVLSDDWIAAESLNWLTPSSFYTVGTEVSIGHSTFSDTSLSVESAATAGLTTDIRMVAALQSIADLAATLDVTHFATTLVTEAVVSGALTTNVRLVGAFASVATVTAALASAIRMGASVTSQASITADLTTHDSGSLAVALVAQTTVTGALTTNIRLAALLASNAGVGGDIYAGGTIRAALTCESAITTGHGNNGFNTKITAKATLTAASNSGVVSTLTASLTTHITMAAPLQVQATVTDNGFRAPHIHLLNCSIAARSSVTQAAMTTSITMACSVAASCAVPAPALNTSITMRSPLLIANATFTELHLMFRVIVLIDGNPSQVPIGAEGGVHPAATLVNGRITEGAPASGPYLVYRLGKLYEVVDEEVIT